MSAYIKFSAVPKGESLATGHEGSAGWIEISSFSWGAGRSVSSGVGTSSKREASAPSVSDITVTKILDSTSPPILQQTLFGKGQTVQIDFTTQQSDKLETYLTYTLTNTLISGYNVSGSSADRPVESLTLNFTKVEMAYQGFKDDGTPDSSKAAKANYDLTLGKPV